MGWFPTRCRCGEKEEEREKLANIGAIAEQFDRGLKYLKFL